MLLHDSLQVWERLRGGLDDNSHRNTSCPTGIHPGGMCSCGSFLMTEESSARASISRIVMLAEALFEVIFFPQLSCFWFLVSFHIVIMCISSKSCLHILGCNNGASIISCLGSTFISKGQVL